MATLERRQPEARCRPRPGCSGDSDARRAVDPRPRGAVPGTTLGNAQEIFRDPRPWLPADGSRGPTGYAVSAVGTASPTGCRAQTRGPSRCLLAAVSTAIAGARARCTGRKSGSGLSGGRRQAYAGMVGKWSPDYKVRPFKFLLPRRQENARRSPNPACLAQQPAASTLRSSA